MVRSFKIFGVNVVPPIFMNSQYGESPVISNINFSDKKALANNVDPAQIAPSVSTLFYFFETLTYNVMAYTYHVDPDQNVSVCLGSAMFAIPPSIFETKT